jgi:hypothetical protein
LQERLRLNPLADSSIADVLVDNENARHIKTSGRKWAVKTEGGYGSTFLVNEPDDKKISTLRFIAPHMKPSRYRVFIYVPKVSGATEFMTITVSDGVKVIERIISPAGIVVEGQTSGEWISLGEYNINEGKRPYVEVTTRGATGKIIADAVIWNPVSSSQLLGTN